MKPDMLHKLAQKIYVIIFGPVIIHALSRLQKVQKRMSTFYSKLQFLLTLATR